MDQQELEQAASEAWQAIVKVRNLVKAGNPDDRRLRPLMTAANTLAKIALDDDRD